MKKIFTIIAVVVILATGSFSLVAAKEKGGCGPACIGCLFGSRAGYMYNEGVKVRTLEWLQLVISPIPQIIDFFSIMGGKTWSEVESDEGL
ncbi:MAG: hypothetical protein ABIJ15_01845 [bacterium]